MRISSGFLFLETHIAINAPSLQTNLKTPPPSRKIYASVYRRVMYYNACQPDRHVLDIVTLVDVQEILE